MNTENRCPQCGAELAANAPRGLCPACLLKGALDSQTTVAAGDAQSASASDFVPPTPAELAPYFPDLEILEFVGRGGMGMVYKARQTHLDRLVALKVLQPKIAQDPAFSARFNREARAMALLSHQHIVAVYDFGHTGVTAAGATSPIPLGEGPGARAPEPAAPLYYFLMEFVDGPTLRQLLNSSKLAPEESLAIVPQICEALQYAHNKGVVHRDIKPENILIDRSGQVKIADFGLAKLTGPQIKDMVHTGTGQVMGTPQYMAPEQIEHPLAVDHRADIYALGVVFYQMLTGELPIGRFAPPSKKVQIDVRLDEVVLRALEKEPERRYQQASQLKTQLETIATTPPSAALAPPAGIATKADIVVAALRWTARAFALAVFLLFAMFFVGERPEGASAMPFGKADVGERIEWVGMSLMVLGLMLGWQWEGLAAICILVGAMEFHVVEWQAYMHFLDLPLVAGVLYGLCWWLNKQYPQTANRAVRAALGGPLVRASDGQPRVYWPGVIKAAFVVIGVALAAQLPVAVFLGGKYHLAALLLLLLMGMGTLALCIYRGLTTPPQQLLPLEANASPASDAELAGGVRAVQGPAVGLIVTSLVNWLTIFFVLPGFVLPMRSDFPPRMPIDIFYLVVAILTLASAVILVGALKMQRLESLAWARAGSVLAMIIGPGYIVGWPVGIWSLVVLSRREVRAAFERNRGLPRAPTAEQSDKTLRLTKRWLRNAAMSVVLGLLIALVVRTFLMEAFVATTDAATPELPRGSRVLVWKFAHEFAPGDLLAYRHNGSASLGRVVREEGTEIVVNRNGAADLKVPRDEVVGKVISIYWRGSPPQPAQLLAVRTLEFHVAPNPPKTNREPIWPRYVGQTKEDFAAVARKELAATGPTARPADGQFQWFELSKKVVAPPAFLTGEYQKKKYILLCARPPYVMLPQPEGNDAWGLQSVGMERNARGRQINLSFNRRGGELFGELTKPNFDNYLAAVVQGRVVSLPKIRSEMGNQVTITGSFSDADIAELLAQLKDEQPAATVPQHTPGIEKVVVENAKATIEGYATKDAKLVFRVGSGWDSSAFRKATRFTAVVTKPWLGRGLDISVTDANGERSLRLTNGTFGPLDRSGEIVFRQGALKPEAGGTFVFADFRPDNGSALPLSVKLEQAEPAAPSALHTIKKFDLTAKTITNDGIAVDQNAWRIEAKGKRTVRLFEISDPGVEDCTVFYRAKLKCENLEGQAYLEMWCRLPAGGEAFSKGLMNPVSGTTDWATCETPFFLQKAQRPDLVKLNVVIEGKGTLWIKDVKLLAGPLPPGGAEAQPQHADGQTGDGADDLIREGSELFEKGGMSEAAAKFAAAVKLAPDDAKAWNGLGWADFNTGKFAEAQKAFEKVIAIDPDHGGGLNGLGQLSLLQGQFDQAEKYLLKAAPQAPAAWAGLTMLYLHQGKFDQAEKWAQKIVDSGDAGGMGRQLLQAAKKKHLSDSLRRMIEPLGRFAADSDLTAGLRKTKPFDGSDHPVTKDGITVGQTKPQEGDDMQAYLSKTQQLIYQRHYQEALDRCLWFHEHALEHDPAMAGVRVSFALSYWRDLAEVYPPAKKALDEVLERSTRELREGRGNPALFQDVASINDTLGRRGQTVQLFEEIDKSHPALAARCWFFAQDTVFAEKRYALAKKYIPQPLQDYDRDKSLYDQTVALYKDPRSGGEHLRDWNKKHFVEQCLQLIELAKFSGDEETARLIRKQAASVVDEPALRESAIAPKTGAAQKSN